MSNLSVRQPFKVRGMIFFVSHFLRQCSPFQVQRDKLLGPPPLGCRRGARRTRIFWRVAPSAAMLHTLFGVLWRRLVVAPLARAAPPPLLRIFWGVAPCAAMQHFYGVAPCSWCIEVYILDLKVTVTKKIFQNAPSSARLGCRRWRRGYFSP